MSYKKERIKYYDLLKFLAIIGIIGIHTFQLWPNAEIMNIQIKYLNEFFRYGVPIFLMVSGALLLNRNIEIENYLKKKIY